MRNERMCLRKRLFWTQGAAEGRAMVIAESGGPKMRAYRCPNCLQFHLTART